MRRIAAEMPKGGADLGRLALARRRRQPTGERRTGIAMNYCAGFIRQQENQQLGIPPEIARVSPWLQELVGYGVYRGLIGHIDKHSPDSCSGGGIPLDLGLTRVISLGVAL